MFSKGYINSFHTNVSNFLLKTLKPLLLIGALIYTVYLLLSFSQEQYINIAKTIKPGTSYALILSVIFLLSIVNWGIESAKWHMLAGKLQNISYLRAFKGVLFGVAMGMITPKRIGEFAGKTIVLDKNKRTEGIMINTTGSLCQLLVTLAAGTISLLLVIHRGTITMAQLVPVTVENYIVLGTLIIISLSVLLFYKNRLSRYLEKYKIIRIIFSRLSVLKLISPRDFLKLLILSVLRYAVFMIQCFFIFYLTGLKLPFAEVFIFQSLVFLMMTILPVTAFSELAVKGSVAVILFGQVFSNSLNNPYGYEISLLAANGLLWLINLGIPAFTGIIWQLNEINLPLKKSLIKLKWS